MFCKSCGNAVAVNTRFCSRCGKKPGDGVVDDTTYLTVTVNHRSLWILLSAVIAVVLLSVAGAFFLSRSHGKTAENLAATNKAIEAVGRVAVAIDVGISFTDYSRRLQDAAATVEAYEPSDGSGKKVKIALAKAVLYYKAALDAWNASINSTLPNDNFNSPMYWISKYPDLVAILPSADVDLSKVKQVAWQVAGMAYQEAKREASSYSN